MRARERPAARLRIQLEPPRQDRLEIDGRLPVPELADVEVPRAALERLRVANPAEENVARGLHQPLTLDDALPVVRVAALPEHRLEDRRACLLHLEKERIRGVTPEQQHDPATSADAPDPDHLPREVDVPEALEQPSPVALER